VRDREALATRTSPPLRLLSVTVYDASHLACAARTGMPPGSSRRAARDATTRVRDVLDAVAHRRFHQGRSRSMNVPPRLLHGFLTVLLLAALLCPAGVVHAQTIQAAGVMDVSPTGSLVLTGDRGFSLSPYFMTINDNMLSVSNCNNDPIHCMPGFGLGLEAMQSDVTAVVTLDGATYRANCFDCTSAFQFRFNGSVVLPPFAPTAVVTAPIAMSATFSPGGGAGQVSIAATGTATVYLTFKSIETLPDHWRVERVVYRLDSPLPAPWMSVDVGQTGRAGTASANTDGSAWTISGAGSDIWGTSDSFRFTFPWPGGNEITARVDSEDRTHAFAKAGVMMRASLSAAAPQLVLDVTPSGHVEFMTRAIDGGPTTYLGGVDASLPVWLRLSQGDSGVVAAISSDGSTWQTVGTTFFQGALVGLAVTSHDPGLLNTAVFSNVRETSGATPGLPAPWHQQDVGDVTRAGGATLTNGVYAVTGDGTDIWGTADAFHFVYQYLRYDEFNNIPGDGEITARVTSVQNTNTFAKAGVMLRDSTAPGAPHVVLDLRPNGTIEFMTRQTSQGETTYLGGDTVTNGTAWLRLNRTGTVFTASVSDDGRAWRTVGSASIPGFGTSTYAGLAVTSHASGVSNTSTFDQVSIVQASASPVPPAPWLTGDVGDPGTAGSSTFAPGGVFTVKGAGADIWGTRDAFQFLYQTGITGIAARIVSESATHPFAKAGVMLRVATGPSAPFVMLDIKPNGELEFMQRATAGGEVTYLGGTSVGFGIYLRVQQSGTTITGSYSHDNSNWIVLGSATMAQAATAGGLVSLSHDTSVLNASVFDTVQVTR
jgi:regulation of enolase protein 1 (concanavalin A-like superfamily)